MQLKQQKIPMVILGAIVALTGLKAASQAGSKAEAAHYDGPCEIRAGQNALTISLPATAGYQVEGVFIRRRGCEGWSKNVGTITPGKSLHLMNVEDVEMEVFWRTTPHRYGKIPVPSAITPTEAEWNNAITTGAFAETVTLKDGHHSRIELN